MPDTVTSHGRSDRESKAYVSDEIIQASVNKQSEVARFVCNIQHGVLSNGDPGDPQADQQGVSPKDQGRGNNGGTPAGQAIAGQMPPAGRGCEATEIVTGLSQCSFDISP